MYRGDNACSLRHLQKNSWKMPNSRLIGYRNIYNVANHVMYMIFFKSKEIYSSLFLRELDEKRNTDRTNLAESITWMKVGFWVHVMTRLISAQMISEKGYPAIVFRLLIPLLLLRKNFYSWHRVQPKWPFSAWCDQNTEYHLYDTLFLKVIFNISSLQ